MAHMDGTGPDGKGSQSGRGLGKAADVSDSKILDKLGVGQGNGQGNRRGMRHGNQNNN